MNEIRARQQVLNHIISIMDNAEARKEKLSQTMTFDSYLDAVHSTLSDGRNRSELAGETVHVATLDFGDGNSYAAVHLDPEKADLALIRWARASGVDPFALDQHPEVSSYGVSTLEIQP